MFEPLFQSTAVPMPTTLATYFELLVHTVADPAGIRGSGFQVMQESVERGVQCASSIETASVLLDSALAGGHTLEARRLDEWRSGPTCNSTVAGEFVGVILNGKPSGWPHICGRARGRGHHAAGVLPLARRHDIERYCDTSLDLMRGCARPQAGR